LTVASCLAFRLDDAQDWFVRLAQMAVIGEFLNKGVPLSIGIISNKFDTGVTADPELVSFVFDAVNNGTSGMEIVSHGYNHEVFSTFTLEEQTALLIASADQIQSNMGVRPVVFVPPFNAFNQNTTKAAVTAGFTHLSSQIALDLAPYNFANPLLWHFPIGASTDNTDDEVEVRPVDPFTTWKNAMIQLSRDGYAAIMVDALQ
jgi:peptidoglycan/xylan/chitin deacetylase (PgdA/CDA1 family)